MTENIHILYASAIGTLVVEIVTLPICTIKTIYQNNQKLNGIPLEKPILNYADIMKGGTLNFKMTTN
jgi:hypothetical protein